MSDLTLSDLADQVLRWCPDGTKVDWGAEMFKLAELYGLDSEVHAKTITALGTIVSHLKARRAKAAKAQRLLDLGVTFQGRPITPTLSIRGEDGDRQLPLWTEASPQQFVEAVLREQGVVDGRNDSNVIRLTLVRAMQADASLMELPTMLDVCVELGIDPDMVGVEEIPS